VSVPIEPVRLEPALRRAVVPLAVALVLALGLAVPLQWYALRVDGVRARARLVAERMAELVRREIDARPRLWRYDTWKLIAHVQPFDASADLRVVVVSGPNGARIEVGDARDRDDLAWGTANLRSGGTAAVWAGLSLAGARSDALRLGALAATLAVVLGILVYAVPVQAARRADRRTDRTARATGLQEAERRAIARDLHDGVGQSLTALRLQLQVLRACGGDEATRSGFEAAMRQVDAALDEIRHAVRSLAPPVLAEGGLAVAVRHLGEDLADRAGIAIAFDVEPLGRLPAGVEAAVYRISQEALTNVVRHASARHVQVTLWTAAGSIELTIADDGKGLPDTLDGGSGLSGMRERAELLGGHCRTARSATGGTVVSARIPLGATQP
jgi:signal transduction histidine kinase